MVKAKPGGTVHRGFAVTRTNVTKLLGCCFFFKIYHLPKHKQIHKIVITNIEQLCAKRLSGDCKSAFDIPVRGYAVKLWLSLRIPILKNKCKAKKLSKNLKSRRKKVTLFCNISYNYAMVFVLVAKITIILKQQQTKTKLYQASGPFWQK